MSENQNNNPIPITPSPRRRVLPVATLLGAVALAAGIGYAVWLRPAPPPEPPSVALDDAEPAVVKAIEAARTEVKEKPRSAATWGRLGLVLRAHFYNREADTCFAQAEQLDARDPRWPYLRALTLPQYDPDPSAILPCLERAVALGGEVPVPRLRLGEVLLELGRRDEAEMHFRQVLKSDPKNPRALLGLGQIAFQRGDLEDSRDYLQRSAAGAPGARATHALLAAVHHRLGNQAAADEELRLTDPLPNDFPWPDPYLAQVRQQRVGVLAAIGLAGDLSRHGRPREAIAALREAVNDYPDSLQATMALARLLLQLGDAAEAERVLREGVRRHADAADAWFTLGLALQEQKKYGAAVESYHKATALKPPFAQAYYNLGLCLTEQRDRDGAIQAYRQAVRYKPDHGPAHLSLGTALEDAGEVAAALEHLQHAVQLAPSDATARKALERVRQRVKRPGL